MASNARSRYFVRMANANDDRITRWLERSHHGDAVALYRLPRVTCEHCRRITSSALRSPTGHGTLQTIAFVNAALSRLFGRPLSAFESHAHPIDVSARKAIADTRESNRVSHEFTKTLELSTAEEAAQGGLDATVGELELLRIESPNEPARESRKWMNARN